MLSLYPIICNSTSVWFLGKTSRSASLLSIAASRHLTFIQETQRAWQIFEHVPAPAQLPSLPVLFASLKYFTFISVNIPFLPCACRCLTSSTRRWFWTSSGIQACWRRWRSGAPASPSAEPSRTSAAGSYWAPLISEIWMLLWKQNACISILILILILNTDGCDLVVQFQMP